MLPIMRSAFLQLVSLRVKCMIRTVAARTVYRQFSTSHCINGVSALSSDNPVVEKYMRNLLTDYQQCLDKVSAVDDEVTVRASDSELVELQSRVVRLKPVVECYRLIERNRQDVAELNKMLADDSMGADMVQLARADIATCDEQLQALNDKLFELLKPAESMDRRDVILEVTAGVGGQEAMLFAKELFDMYTSYAQWKGWHTDILDYQLSELSNSIRHASVSVSGDNVFFGLKFEGGVHRVQRIPQTEKAGRIHTSTVAVAVLPQAFDEEVILQSKDIKVDTKRSSGAGGQHVNTTESAIRLTHIPTGIIVECQTDRSQIKNKQSAMKKLQTKLFQNSYQEQLNKQQSSRKIQIGTSGRSEKIRTYNFVQDRITDHRCGINCFNLKEFLKGGPELDDLIESLSEESKKEILLDIFQTSSTKSK